MNLGLKLYRIVINSKSQIRSETALSLPNLLSAPGGQRNIFQKGNLSPQQPDAHMKFPMPGRGHGDPMGPLAKQHLLNEICMGRAEVITIIPRYKDV